MATALQQDGSPYVAGEIIAVDANDIDATERLRPVDEGWARALGQIMLAEGQNEPIRITPQLRGRPWRLVYGAHRLRAALIFPEINPLLAIETQGSELSRRQAEIAENLWRRELSPLDRAAFVAEMHDVLRAKAGIVETASAQSIAANARWRKELRKATGDASVKLTDAYGFTDQIAEQARVSKSAIERSLLLARRISPAVREQLRGHPVGENASQLRAIAKLEAPDQAAVVERLVAGAKNVAEALAAISNRQKPSPEDRRLSSFIGTYARMSITEKKGALAQLGGMLPAGFRLVEEKA